MASIILNRCCGVNFFFAVSACLLAAGPASAAPRPRTSARPAQSLERRLLDAYARHDPVELERVARRLGVGGLRGALGSTRPARTAALAAAPLVPKSWLLLPKLVLLCAERDRTLALAAAEAVHRIAEDLRRPELQLNEDLPETLAPWARQLVRLAADRQVSLDVRVKCVQSVAQLLELVPLPVEALLPLLADAEPAVRRSATELFVHTASEQARARLAKLVASDEDLNVSRAAAAVLCAEVPLARNNRAPNLAALQEAGAISRLRELTESADAGLDQLLEVARCLTRLGTAADRKALRAIASRSPSLRRALQHLGD